MPYEIRMQGDKHCVFNKDTGDNKGCSDSHEMAVKHMRALYANAGGKALEGWLELDDALEGPMRKSAEDLVNFLQVLDEPVTSVIEPAVESKSTDTVESVDVVKSIESVGAVEWIQPKQKGWWSTIIDRFNGRGSESGSAGVLAYKQADGRIRVIMRGSNMFKDRHKEIITSEAHKNYVEWVDQSPSERMPEFWLWHTKGTRWGQADGLDFSDGFLTITGLADVDKESTAIKLAELGPDIGVSHGFYPISIQGKGFIDLYRSFEFSPLPRREAANLWTAMMLVKEAELPISDAKRKFFIDDLGIPADYVARIEQENKSEADAIKAMGIAWKSDSEGEAGAGPNASGGDAGAASNVSTESGQPTLADVMARLDSLAGEINGIKEKAVSGAADDAVAQALEAAMASGKGFVPSQAKDNAASPGDAAAQKSNWFDEVVVQPAFGVRG